MGQYYKPVNLDKKKADKYEALYSHTFGNGLKLTEHSYIGNNFVEAVEILLTRFGPWYKGRIVWAGDYADGENGGEADALTNPNIWHLADEEVYVPYEIDQIKKEFNIDLEKFPFVVNHTLKQFVDKRKMEAYGFDSMDLNDRGYRMHPLPLLTAEGNGRGGGDYHSNYPDYELIGIWARHSISVEEEVPEGYEELLVHFRE